MTEAIIKIALENLDKVQAAFAEMQTKYEALLEESRCDRIHAVSRICMLEMAVEDLQIENSRLEQKILNMKKPGGILHDG
jgi:hypothetical protein